MALGCSGGEPGVWREDIGAIDTDETRQMRRSERVDVGSREPWSGTISPAGRVSLRLALQSTRGRGTKPNLWPGLDPGHWTSLWGAQKQNVTGLKGQSRENSVILMFCCCSNRTLWFTEFYYNTLVCRVLEKRSNRPSVKTGPLSNAGGFLNKLIKVVFFKSNQWCKVSFQYRLLELVCTKFFPWPQPP